MQAKLFDKLNPAQRAAATYGVEQGAGRGSPPLLVGLLIDLGSAARVDLSRVFAATPP